MIESADRRITSTEYQAGLNLLRRLSTYREAVRTLGTGHSATKLHAIRLSAAERIYDSLPVEDKQVRDSLDDALMVAGWERLA